MDAQKVYKVVFRDGDDLVSAVAEGEAKVVYIPGQAAKPPAWLEARGYLLTAFSSLRAARRFRNTCSPIYLEELEIWEAEATGCKRRRLPPRLACEPLSYRLTDARSVNPWPAGTIMAQELTLLRQVE